MKKWIMPAIAGIGTAVGLTGGIIGICSAAAPSPVYICQDYTNCTDGQFLLIKDHLGAPIFAVGETGGAKTFGDSTSVYPPTDIFDPAATISYQAPSGSCKPPALWLSPQGIFTCRNGAWVNHGF